MAGLVKHLIIPHCLVSLLREMIYTHDLHFYKISPFRQEHQYDNKRSNEHAGTAGGDKVFFSTMCQILQGNILIMLSDLILLWRS